MTIGVDLGGTKTLVARFKNGVSTPKIETQEKFDTTKDFGSQVDLLISAISSLTKKRKPTKIVIGNRGELDSNQLLTDLKLLGWDHVPLRQRLEKAFGCPVFLYNDSFLAGLAEATIGAGKKYSRVLYTTISTGIGAAFIVNGQPIITGTVGGDMVIGKTKLDKNSRISTFEKLLSGSAIRERYGKYGFEIKDKKIWREIAQQLALGINNFIVMVRPDIVVVGGGFGHNFENFEAPLRETLERNSTYQYPLPVVAEAHLQGKGVIYGCAVAAKSKIDV